MPCPWRNAWVTPGSGKEMRSFISLSNMGFASSHPPSAAFDHIDTQITCAYMPIPGSRAASSIASSQHDVCLLRSPMTCYVSCLHHISHSLCAHMPIPGSRPASSIASSQHDVCLLRSVSRTRLFKGCRSRNEAIHLPLLPSPRLLNAPGSGGVGDRSGGQGTCAESAPMAAIARSQSPLPGCAGHASENASNAGQRAGPEHTLYTIAKFCFLPSPPLDLFPTSLALSRHPPRGSQIRGRLHTGLRHDQKGQRREAIAVLMPHSVRILVENVWQIVHSTVFTYPTGDSQMFDGM